MNECFLLMLVLALPLVQLLVLPLLLFNVALELAQYASKLHLDVRVVLLECAVLLLHALALLEQFPQSLLGQSHVSLEFVKLFAGAVRVLQLLQHLVGHLQRVDLLLEHGVDARGAECLHHWRR